MKKTITLFLSLAVTSFCVAQENPNIAPYSFEHSITQTMPTIILPQYDFTQDIIDAQQFEKMGNYPRFARHFDLSVTPQNSGVWTELNNGDRVWRLAIKSPGALSIDLFFDNFLLPHQATLHVYTPDHKQGSGSFTYLDNQGDGLFSTPFLTGDEQVVEYFEPANVRGQGTLRLTQIAHQFRSLPMADDCEVNVICSPEGNSWQDEKKGVVRIYVVEGSLAGYCSGSLINNTSQDCTRYILTAFHCGVNSSTANFNGWKFYFNYEATLCTGQSDIYGTITNVMTGCTKIASSNDNGGDTGSDFLLLKMTSTSAPSWWSGVYYNGWNKNNTAPVAGSMCIHHPNGDNKKISVTTGTGTSTSWGGVASSTHWQIHWGGTTHGWGVTEGGSSGSPLFNTTGFIIGTLTGGGSYCNSVVAGGQNQPDAYGKLSYHWASNGTTSATQLKPWLDPTNSGVAYLNGNYSPCTFAGINENQNNNSLTIFPNPGNGNFTIALSLNMNSDIKIRILDVLGQQINSSEINNSMGGNFQIDLTNQSTGIYFVEVKTKDFTEVKKLSLIK